MAIDGFESEDQNCKIFKTKFNKLGMIHIESNKIWYNRDLSEA